MIFEEFSQSYIVRLVGLLVVLRFFLKVAFFIYDYLQSRFLAGDFSSYGEWAVITGSTDGIGKAIGKELAKRGVNIILISRNKTKLHSTAQEIEDEYKVNTYCVQADFTDRNCFETIKDHLNDKDIGILVNNVGILDPEVKDFTSQSEDHLWNEIIVNCGAAAIMTRIILPCMKEKKKGLIINMGSIAEIFGFPGMGLYAATKSFLSMFSHHLKLEASRDNVQVLCLTPGPISTKLLGDVNIFFDKMEKGFRFFDVIVPNATKYSQHAIYSFTSKSSSVTGYWPHSIMAAIGAFGIPLGIRISLTSTILTFVKSYISIHKND